MEVKRLISLIYGSLNSNDIVRDSTNKRERLWNLYIRYARNMSGNAFNGKNIDAIIERNKGNYRNFVNSFLNSMESDTTWEHQYFRMVYIGSRFEPSELCKRLLKAADYKLDIFKKDTKALAKLFLAFNDGNAKVFQYIDVDLNLWEMLSKKYELTKETLTDFAWTFPHLIFAMKRMLPNLEENIGKNMFYKYVNFKPELGFIGLFGLIPKDGRFGGLIKLILHYNVLQLMKAFNENDLQPKVMQKTANMILEDILGLALVIFHSNVYDGQTRQQYFYLLEITPSDMEQWETVFDQEFPTFRLLPLIYFEQSM